MQKLASKFLQNISILPKKQKTSAKATAEPSSSKMAAENKNGSIHKILFLKTDEYTVATSAPSHQVMFRSLKAKGYQVDERSWLNPDPELGKLDLDAIKGYDVVSFLACYEYNRHIGPFLKFVEEVLRPAQQEHSVRFVNDLDLIVWNSNKEYLMELVRDIEGVVVPGTSFVDVFVDDSQWLSLEWMLERHWKAFPEGKDMAQGKVVVKPSVSASSKETFLIPDFGSEEWLAGPAGLELNYMDVCKYVRTLAGTVPPLSAKTCLPKVMLQTYEPAITNGEYSIIFVKDEYSHTMVKVPAKKEFRAGWEFGGRTEKVAEKNVPLAGKEVGRKVVDYVKQRFGLESLGYLRLDGVMRKDGVFAIIEAEMFEPYTYLDGKAAATGLGRLEDLLGP